MALKCVINYNYLSSFDLQQVLVVELEHSSIFFEEQHPSFLLSEEQLAFSEEAHDDCFFVSELQVALFAVELLFSFSLEQHDFLESEDEHDSFFRYLFDLLKYIIIHSFFTQ